MHLKQQYPQLSRKRLDKDLKNCVQLRWPKEQSWSLEIKGLLPDPELTLENGQKQTATSYQDSLEKSLALALSSETPANVVATNPGPSATRSTKLKDPHP